MARWKSFPFNEPTSLSTNCLSSCPKPIEFALTCQAPGFHRVRRHRSRVGCIDAFVHLPRRFKTGQHSHYLQQNGPAMSKVLPRTEHSNDIRIDLSLRVRKEYIVG